MHEIWRADYKGYGIIPGASWSSTEPFSAHFSITKSLPDGTNEIVDDGYCEGAFQTEEAAWDAATIEARKVIDKLPAIAKSR